MSSVTYTKPGFITAAFPKPSRDTRQYGGNIRTDWMLRCADGRIRRLYAMSYANAPSFYVRIDGEDVFLDIDAWDVLRTARNVALRVPVPKPIPYGTNPKL